MDYMRQFNAFGVKSAGILSSGAVNLYVRMFLFNNQHGWTEYFPASHSLLCMMTGIGSRNTIDSLLEELRQGGFIEWKKGGGRKPNLYKLINLYCSKTEQQTEQQTEHIKDYRHKTKNNPLTPQGRSAPNLQEERFTEFWKAYPKKVGKGAALKAYAKIKPTAELHKEMLEALEKQKHSVQWRRDGGQYIPNPSTWLNQSRWEDEVPMASGYGEGGAMPFCTLSPEEQEERRRMDMERDKRIAAMAEGRM